MFSFFLHPAGGQALLLEVSGSNEEDVDVLLLYLAFAKVHEPHQALRIGILEVEINQGIGMDALL